MPNIPTRILPTLALFALLVAGLLTMLPSHAVAGPPAPHRLAAPDGIIPGQPFTMPFPRLGMWWPDPENQSLDDIARYDWITLFDYQDDYVDSIKQHNPDILILDSTNACELGYEWDPEVREMPAEWFLTQVGTTLTQDVNATETTFHVAEVTVSDGENTYNLFVKDDTAVIEGESVKILAVDKANKTLLVQRGFYRPASAHSAGTRIAAHISFWPGTWVMNLSTLSPTAVISTSTQPERWGDYNARVGIDLLSDPHWDGLLIDRSDPNQSWLVSSGYARTIDPDQSNTLLTDYSAFDAAWNEGLRQYEEQIRAGVGDERLIFANWGMNNYDLLNGNNFEGFPPDGADDWPNWHSVMFGPFEADKGNYFDWIAQARQPNMTMIETYEIDGYHENNPCDDPGFVPNYRKMRFGLGSALLNDGFFSYEIGTNGHGSLCLLWFDEYDNAGAGRGYLGQPLGPAYRLDDQLPILGENLIQGGDFETADDMSQWDLWADTDNGYQASFSQDTTTAATGSASGRVDITQTQGTDWQVSLENGPLEVISGTEYTLSFWAKADRERPLSAWVQQNQDPWEGYIYFEDVTLTTEWQHFEMTAQATGSDSQAVLDFGLGQALGAVWLDDVQLRQGSPDVWRRDYDGGTVLVNATTVTHTVTLDRTYRKIDGGQDPAHNDGRLTAEVELAPRDAIILLHTDIYLPLITITAQNATDLRLSWKNDGSYAHYRVYRAPTPYFTPSGTPLAVINQAPWQFDDPGALGDPATNHYYKVLGERADDSSTLSNHTGEFDFGLTPGN